MRFWQGPKTWPCLCHSCHAWNSPSSGKASFCHSFSPCTLPLYSFDSGEAAYLSIPHKLRLGPDCDINGVPTKHSWLCSIYLFAFTHPLLNCDLQEGSMCFSVAVSIQSLHMHSEVWGQKNLFLGIYAKKIHNKGCVWKWNFMKVCFGISDIGL